jgi:ABC-type nitrate/sulfonate/bicarbonate transport system substrate-binding protein
LFKKKTFKLIKPSFAVLIMVFFLTGSGFSSAVDKVGLQLRWFHQFQFAGYYAAIEKGFYKHEGLDVEIVEGGKDRDPIERVLSGEVDFGTTNSEVLLHRLWGDPLVALAVIFQHSPLVLVTLAGSSVNNPQDLAGKKVMMMQGTRDVEILAMLQSEGLSPDLIKRIDARFRIEDYFDRSIAAHSAYITNQPFYLKKKGFPYRVIYPANYGIDFYGDTLFTSENVIKKRPDVVRRFRKATLRGWDYAMSNKEELVEIIVSKYRSQKSRDHLLYEALQMEKLILPGLIETGHMNPGRWKHIADIFVKLGMINPGYTLEGFIFEPDPKVD